MKFIKIIFFSLLALALIACAGVFIFLQIFDTDQYLPQITQKASIALGRPVSIGHMGLGLSSRGLTLDAGPLTITDDKDFTAQPFIKINRVRVSLDLSALIFQHQIRISHILLQSPQIHFIRAEDGSINIHSIGHVDLPAGDQTTVNAGTSSAIPGQSKVLMPGLTDEQLRVPVNTATHSSSQFFNSMKYVEIQDAAISYIDQSQDMPLDIWLSNISATINGFSIDPSDRSVRISDLRVLLDLSQLDNKDIWPENQGSLVFKNITGFVKLNVSQIGMGAAGGLVANGDITTTSVIIRKFNIIKLILSHTLGVFGDIDNILSGQLKVKLGADDTILKNTEIKFSIHDKVIDISDLLVSTDIFELTAHGSVDQGSNIDMQTILHLNPDVSAALVSDLDGVKYLMDDSKRVTIDASLQGVVPHLKYKPNKDFRKKGKKAINAMFRQLFGA